MKYFYICFSLFLFSCGTAPEKGKSTLDSGLTSAQVADTTKASVKDSVSVNKDILEYRLTVNPSLPPITFYIFKKSNTVGRANEDKKIIQTFEVSDFIDLADENMTDPTTFMSAQDFNFDGYKDLMITSSYGTGGTWYDIYLYEKENNKFVPHEQLSSLTSPSADSVNKTVDMYDVGGMAGAWYTFITYQWKDKKLVPIRKEVQSSESPDSEVFIRTISLPDAEGNMKVVCSVRIDQYGEKERHCLQEGEWTEFDKNPNYIFVGSDEEVMRVDGRNGGCGE